MPGGGWTTLAWQKALHCLKVQGYSQSRRLGHQEATISTDLWSTDDRFITPWLGLSHDFLDEEIGDDGV